MSRNVPAIFPQLSKPLALLTLSLLALSGCGQKGPLYMPGDEEAAKTYDPQGVYEEDTRPSGSAAQSPGEEDADTADQAPQASPAPAATQPNAEELP
ncbi:LPS translocon maturation chaperone LptM [Salinicola salarius]|uniref:LPS translocon maturation chaperone LptM n=1 Tax=Salinicola salarius TaxID=430457 RepID=UPI000B3FC0A1